MRVRDLMSAKVVSAPVGTPVHVAFELMRDGGFRHLPVLSTIAGWKYGFDSPFKSEIYFVSTRQITDLKWGTPNPVMMRDPDFGNIRVRAFGTYTLKAKDPKILLRELVGTDGIFETEEISELLRSIVNTSFADVVAKSEIPVLDFAAHYNELRLLNGPINQVLGQDGRALCEAPHRR